MILVISLSSLNQGKGRACGGVETALLERAEGSAKALFQSRAEAVLIYTAQECAQTQRFLQ